MLPSILMSLRVIFCCVCAWTGTLVKTRTALQRIKKIRLARALIEKIIGRPSARLVIRAECFEFLPDTATFVKRNLWIRRQIIDLREAQRDDRCSRQIAGCAWPRSKRSHAPRSAETADSERPLRCGGPGTLWARRRAPTSV